MLFRSNLSVIHPIRETFAKSLRSINITNLLNPGPGDYQKIVTDDLYKPKRLLEQESCTFGIRPKKLTSTNQTPGPNVYFNDVSNKTIGYTFSKSLKKIHKLINYPDKFYDKPNIFPSPKISFGKEKRQSRFNLSRYPGPGTYNIPNIIGEFPKYFHDKTKINITQS